MDEKKFEELSTDVESIKTILVSFNKRLEQQNERLLKLEGNSVPSPTAHKEFTSAQQSSFDAANLVNSAESVTQNPTYSSGQVSGVEASQPSFNFLEWMSVDWPMKLGALLLILGMGWFVSYAFLNNWIGPIGRISLGLLTGAGLLAFGQHRMKDHLDQAPIVISLGAIFIFMTTSAASAYYGFFDPVSASLLMLLVVAYIAFISIQFKSKTLATLSLFFGAVVPILVSTGEDQSVSLFSYLFILSIGASIVTWKIGYRKLLIYSLFIVILYSLPYAVGFTSFDRFIAIIIALAFAGLFFGVSFMTLLKNGQMDAEDLVITSLNSILLILWIRFAVDPEWRGFMSLAIAFVLSIIAYFIAISEHKNRTFAYFRFASALIFVVAASVFQFSGPVLTIALATEFTLLTLIARSLLKNMGLVRLLAKCTLIPLVMSLPYLFDSYLYGVDLQIDRYVVILTIIIASTILWRVLRVDADEVLSQDMKITENPEVARNHSKNVSLESFFMLVAAVYSLVLVWIFFHDALSSDMLATIFSLLVYTCTGMVLYVSGKRNDNEEYVMFGGLLFALVTLRLLLVDVWDMSLTGRIVTFFIIGALFVSTAFVGKKKETLIS